MGMVGAARGAILGGIFGVIFGSILHLDQNGMLTVLAIGFGVGAMIGNSDKL